MDKDQKLLSLLEEILVLLTSQEDFGALSEAVDKANFLQAISKVFCFHPARNGDKEALETLLSFSYHTPLDFLTRKHPNTCTLLLPDRLERDLSAQCSEELCPIQDYRTVCISSSPLPTSSDKFGNLWVVEPLITAGRAR